MEGDYRECGLVGGAPPRHKGAEMCICGIPRWLGTSLSRAPAGGEAELDVALH
jgi:hypothetical protein